MANDNIDYEKQFEADLERAQALSLESLALEKFRNQKLMQDSRCTSSSSATNLQKVHSTSVARSHSVTETDLVSARHQIKPRPQKPIINTAMSNSSAEPDLISFTSPPHNSKLIDFCQQLHNSLNTFSKFENSQSINVSNASGGQSTNQNLQYGPQWQNDSTKIPSSSSMYGSQSMMPLSKAQFAIKPLPALPIQATAYNKSSLEVLKAFNKKDNSNLIDLTPSGVCVDRNSVRVSVLEAFDPLLTSPLGEGTLQSLPTASESSIAVYQESASSTCDSLYDEYDPFEYLYSGSGSNSLSDPLYAAVVKSEKVTLSPPPPLPPKAQRTMDRRKNIKDGANTETKKTRLYDNISVKKRPGLDNKELIAFHNMVKTLRRSFKYNNPDTNMGLIVSPMMQNQYREGTSIKLCVYPYYDAGSERNCLPSPITFTSDVTCSVEHVTLHVTCELEAPTSEQYTLKVWGYNEYLVPTTLLSDYEYIHNCIKLEQDVVLCLIPDRAVDHSLARTFQDDQRDMELSLDDLVLNEPVLPISRDTLIILLETLEGEIDKVENAAADIESKVNSSFIPSIHPNGVIQALKAVCKLMGSLETPDISDAVDAFVDSCQHFLPQHSERRSHIEHTDYVKARVHSLRDAIGMNCEKIRTAVQSLIEMYCQAFRVNFAQISSVVADTANPESFVTDVQDTILLRICALHRPPSHWKHDDYMIALQVYHGTRPIGSPVLSPLCTITTSYFPRILFNNWLDMEDITICSLAREARLVLVLYGRTQQTSEGTDNNNTLQYEQEELGWTAVQFFNYEGTLITGSRLLSLWPPSSSHKLGPAPQPGTHPITDHPVLSVEFPGPASCSFPPLLEPNTSANIQAEFNSLDENTQQQLLDITSQDTLSKPPIEAREILWEKRHYLYHIPDALPKVLLAAHSWDFACLPDLYGMIDRWSPLPGVHAMELLLPIYPDIRVRSKAVRWIKSIKVDELVDYLPQLVVALRHEMYDDSALAAFLLDRALRSPRVAHHLYWLLAQKLPSTCPQNFTSEFSSSSATNDVDICSARYYRRLILLLRALLGIAGEALRNCFITQQILVKNLYDIAEHVKNSKESQRLNTLCTHLDSVHHSLVESPTVLPISPSMRVAGVNVRQCSYFPSNTLPLKVMFLSPDGLNVPAIFKVGDDLLQDMLTLQMVRIMDKLWLKEGLDLKIVAFGCVPTGQKRGMIEMVSNAETLRKIQVEFGLTGSFKDKPIAEWLAKHNPSELEYERAVENFTASCAGYSVVTYILGICDRHNDNIMLKTSGHLFHIDFGKFLGDAQMFGNFKRDRTPFVLTSDMAYVINGGDRPTAKFHKFVDLCCQAFNIVRSNGNLILHLFTLMASSGIQGVTTEAVSYVHRALLPGCSKPEAAAIFARLIQSSLKSWFTQFNFFLHNLAQLRFTGEHGDGELLSFVPKTYSMSQDGRLTHVTVVCHQKRYDPDKYYVYILRVQRDGQPHTTDVHRTYKEFCELHQKLCIHFPLAKLHSLPMGMHMGRSNIKQVAEKRLSDIKLFILSLFRCADEIAHSDLVYTFFHPSLRDQQAPEQFTRKMKDRRVDQRSQMGILKGQLKLSLQYNRGVLSIMVHHARSLSLVGGSQEPSTYVKVYLLPDPSKSTKRKTKVVRRSCHPSFMEMLEYRMQESIINERILQATVWNQDTLQENEFLGGIQLELSKLDLSREMTEWFPLSNISR